MMTMFFEESILKRAQKKGLVEVYFHDLHDYSLTRYGSVDDYPYGGAAGMVMAVEPIANCIEGLQKERHYDDIIYTAPDGEMFSQPMANTLSLAQNLMVLCGHYKGVDERIREHFITREISIGDYVLTGGELAAAVMARHGSHLRCRYPSRSRRYRRRTIGPWRLLPGRSRRTARIHSPAGVPRLVRTRRAPQRQPRQNRTMAHGASHRTHQGAPPRPSK